MDVGSLNINLTMSLDKFQQAIRTASQQIDTMGKELEQALGPKPRKEIDKTQSRLSQFTWTARGYIKDVSKVITGILISQGFYKLLSTIEQSTAALFEFNSQLQTAAISFKYLLGSSREADAFVQRLQDFAADTPLAFEQTTKLAQQLLAYGVPKESILYTLQSILDAAAIRGGGVDAIEGIGRAIGQMAAKSKVEAQELRQLAEWGVPAYRILQEELGLTAEQVQNIGREGIPGIKAADAILRGLAERYGGVSEEVARTTSGLIEKIGDNLKILGNIIFAPVLERTHEFLLQIADRLESLREIARTSGLGGLFEALVPPELRETVISVITGVYSIVEGLQKLWEAIKPAVAAWGEFSLRLAGLVLPLLGLLINALGSLARWLTSNTPLTRGLVGAITSLAIAGSVTFLVAKLVGAIKALVIAGPVAKAVLSLYKALLALHTLMIRSPWIGLITLAATALIGLALNSKTASQWLDAVMQRISALLGLEVGQALEPSDPQAVEDWWGDYNKSLTEAANGLGVLPGELDDISDSAGDAGKKVDDKFLASFDEVYQIPEKLDDAGIGDALEGALPTDISPPPIPPLPELPTETMEIPSITWEQTKPSLLDQLKALLDELNKTMEDQPPLMIPGPGWETPLGVPAEDLARFLEKLQEMFDLALEDVREWVRKYNEILDQLGLPLVPGPLPGLRPLPAPEPVTQPVPGPVPVPGPLPAPELAPLPIPIPKGFVDTLEEAYKRTKEIMDKMRKSLQPIPGVIQEALGGAYEGVKTNVGLIIDSLKLLPSRASTAFGGFLEATRTFLDPAVTKVIDFATGVIGGLRELPSQAAEALSAFKDKVSETLSSVGSFLEENKALILTILAALGLAIAAWFLGLPAAIGTAVAGFVMFVVGAFGDIKTASAAELDETKTAVVTKWNEIKTTISTTLSNILNDITTKWNNIKTTISTTLSNILNDITTKWNNIKTTISTTLSNILNDITTKWNNIKTTISTTLSSIQNVASTSWENIKTTIGSKLDATQTAVTTKWNNIKKSLEDVWRSLDRTASDIWGSIKETIRGSINGWIEMINRFIRAFNRIKIQIPSVDIPLVGTVGGWTIGVPQIREIPTLDAGGIVTRDTLAQLAANNRPEAVIPLSGEQAYPFAEMIADALLDALATTRPGVTTEPSLPPMYVGTLIADERGLKELARRVELINLRETQRRGVS